MPRDLRNEREFSFTVCNADACSQGRKRCPVPQACAVSEGRWSGSIPAASESSWFWSTLAVSALGVLGLAVVVFL
jgi:hypothetical protein